jgi:hypothetical protein
VDLSTGGRDDNGNGDGEGTAPRPTPQIRDQGTRSIQKWHAIRATMMLAGGFIHR